MYWVIIIIYSPLSFPTYFVVALATSLLKSAQSLPQNVATVTDNSCPTDDTSVPNTVIRFRWGRGECCIRRMLRWRSCFWRCVSWAGTNGVSQLFNCVHAWNDLQNCLEYAQTCPCSYWVIGIKPINSVALSNLMMRTLVAQQQGISGDGAQKRLSPLRHCFWMCGAISAFWKCGWCPILSELCEEICSYCLCRWQCDSQRWLPRLYLITG